MQKTKILMLALFALLAIIACRKDDPTPDDDNDDDQVQQGEAISSLSSFWQDQKAAKVQRLTATIAPYNEVIGAKGTKISFYSNSFLLNGAPVTGSIDVDLIEAYDKSDILEMGLNTMGRDEWGNYGAMISAGEFYLNASQNGQTLTINPNSPVQIATASFPDADFNNSMMPLLLEADSTVGDSVWVPIDTFMGNCQDSAMILLGQSNYCFQISDNSSWINCDYFASWNTPLTGMTVNLPSTYNASNTQVIISFDALNLITDLYDNSGSSFSTGTYYQIPIGQQIHLIVIAEQNGVLVYNIQAITVVNGQTVTLAASDIVGTTAANLQTQLSNLP